MPPIQSRLQDIPLGQLRAHPANPNVMDDRRLAKLCENIRRQGDYPPLIVRPHPVEGSAFQIIDGHQRAIALGQLGYQSVRCYVWPCSDEQALLLLGTLNRLHGEDEPSKRAELLAELARLMPAEELAALLPEDATQLARTLSTLDLDVDSLLAELMNHADGGDSLSMLSFMVSSGDEAEIERAIANLVATLSGSNRRGRALAVLARRYIEGGGQHG